MPLKKGLDGGRRGVLVEEIGISKTSCAHYITLIQGKFPLKGSPYTKSVHGVY